MNYYLVLEMLTPVVMWVGLLLVLPLLIYRVFFKEKSETFARGLSFNLAEVRHELSTVARQQGFHDAAATQAYRAYSDRCGQLNQSCTYFYAQGVQEAHPAQAVYLGVDQIKLSHRHRHTAYRIFLARQLTRSASERPEVSIPACYLVKRSLTHLGQYVFLRSHKIGDPSVDQKYAIISKATTDEVRALFANDLLRTQLEQAFELGYQMIDFQYHGHELALRKNFQALEWSPDHLSASIEVLHAIAAELPPVNTAHDQTKPALSQVSTGLIFALILLILIELLEFEISSLTQPYEAVTNKLSSNPLVSNLTLLGFNMVYLWWWRYTFKGFRGCHNLFTSLIWGIGQVILPVTLYYYWSSV